MRDQTRDTLRRVVEKSAKLEDSSFVEQSLQRGWSVNYESATPAITGRSEEARDSLILTLRSLFVKNESTAFRALADHADEDEDDISDEWKIEFRLLRESLNDHLDTSFAQYAYGRKKHRFTNRDIMNTFLYGGLVHANDRDALARFGEWSRYPWMLSLLEMWFVRTIELVLQLVFLPSSACQAELAREQAATTGPKG